MAVVIETTLGDITVDLYLDQRPVTCLNFLKLCKMKYYNFNLFHTIRNGFIAQTGDPSGEGFGGQSIWGILEGPEKRFFSGEKRPKIRHSDAGLLSMVCTDDMMVGSQFFFTLAPDLDSLDGTHCVIGEVTEGHEVLTKLNEVICDESHRPYRDVRITHTVVLEDPFSDPPGLRAPSRSPSPNPERLKGGRIAPDEDIDETQGKSAEEIQEIIEEKEAKARATILEIVGDLPDADIAPPENVLFICKLNPVTSDEDLEIIFSRFGKIVSCEVIRDKKTGNSLQYAFIEFENKKSCEDAYFKMDNVLIDDRRIHVDFSQSVSKMRWLGKGRGVQYFVEDSKNNYVDNDQNRFKRREKRYKTDERENHSNGKRYSGRNDSNNQYRGDNDRQHRESDRQHDDNIENDRQHKNDGEKDRQYKDDREKSRQQKENREKGRQRKDDIEKDRQYKDNREKDRQHKGDKEKNRQHNDDKKRDRQQKDDRENDRQHKDDGGRDKSHKNDREVEKQHRENKERDRLQKDDRDIERQYKDVKKRSKQHRDNREREKPFRHDSRGRSNSRSNLSPPSDKISLKDRVQNSKEVDYDSYRSYKHKNDNSINNHTNVRKSRSPTRRYNECSDSDKQYLLESDDRDKVKRSSSNNHQTYSQNRYGEEKKHRQSSTERNAEKRKRYLEPKTPSPVISNKKNNKPNQENDKPISNKKSKKTNTLKRKRKNSTSSDDSSDSSSSSSDSSTSSESDSRKKKLRKKQRKHSTSSSSSCTSSSSSSSSSSDSSSESSSSSDCKRSKRKHKKSIRRTTKKPKKSL